MDLKKVAYEKRGDKIVVKLRDHNWNTYYENEVGIKDKDGIKKLVRDLKNFGIDFTRIPSGEDWFD